MRLRPILTQVRAGDDIDDHGLEGHCNFLFLPPFHLASACRREAAAIQSLKL
jgi:hypothetical protein